jgi:hypothetical protein
MGVLFRAVSFRAFHRLPAVTVRTPTGQKINNRSIAGLLSNFTMCISRSKLWRTPPVSIPLRLNHLPALTS